MSESPVNPYQAPSPTCDPPSPPKNPWNLTLEVLAIFGAFSISRREFQHEFIWFDVALGCWGLWVFIRAWQARDVGVFSFLSASAGVGLAFNCYHYGWSQQSWLFVIPLAWGLWGLVRAILARLHKPEGPVRLFTPRSVKNESERNS